VKSYNSKIAKNRKVELVMISGDRNVSTATSWAKKEKFPWPTVLSGDQENFMLNKYASRGIPHYIMIDKDGNTICTGKEACLQKASSVR